MKKGGSSASRSENDVLSPREKSPKPIIEILLEQVMIEFVSEFGKICC
jgi:hypothetical protein